MRSARLLGLAAWSLLQPRACAACAAPVDEPVCQACWAAVAPSPGPVRPLTAPAEFPTTVCAAAYVGVVRELLVAHKEHARTELARPLGTLLAAAVVGVLDEPGLPVTLVPVPSRRSATRQRGHDAVLRMAREASRTLGEGASVAAVLGHRRRVEDQSGLGVAQRRQNLVDALVASRVPRAPGGGVLVVVDDVCSSGATLAAASAALHAAGQPRDGVRAAVVASPPLRMRGTRDHLPVTGSMRGD